MQLLTVRSLLSLPAQSRLSWSRVKEASRRHVTQQRVVRKCRADEPTSSSDLYRRNSGTHREPGRGSAEAKAGRNTETSPERGERRHRGQMFPFGLSVLMVAALLGSPPRAQAAACEPVRIPLCRSMPWNMTKMPNHLHHSTQANAVLAIEQFEGLLGTGCSPDLLFFLCAMYAPICTIDFQHEPIKPCKAVCERAKCGCEPVMKRYNHTWPESLACSELPLYDRGVCISPEAIVKADGPDQFYQDPSRCNPESSPDFPMDSNNFHCKGSNADRCTCKTVRLGPKIYRKNNYNYVIRARVREVRSRGLELTAVVDVKEVLKSSLVNIPRETQTLYYSSSCLCPPLSVGEDYIIMGYENEERSRLLLIEGSIAQKWRDRMGRKVKRWDQILQAKTASVSGAQRRSRH